MPEFNSQLTIFHLGDAVESNRPIPESERGKKKTFSPEATSLDYSADRRDNYQADDYPEKDITDRFSTIWNKIQGIYPGNQENIFYLLR